MDETQGRFVSLLEQEVALLKNLKDLLIEETDALKAKDDNLINDITANKNPLLDKLGILDKQRQLFLESGGNSAVYDQAFESQISKMKETIQQLLDECKHQNKINGSIIEISQLFNNRMLDIVFGNDSQNETYSAEGKNSSKSYQNSIARV